MREDVCAETERVLRKRVPRGHLLVKSRVRRVFGDALVSAGMIAIVLAVLVSVDERVREQFRAAVDSASPSSVAAGTGTQLSEVGVALFDAARTQSIEHAPLMIFVVVATMLVLFMVRT